MSNNAFDLPDLSVEEDKILSLEASITDIELVVEQMMSVEGVSKTMVASFESLLPDHCPINSFTQNPSLTNYQTALVSMENGKNVLIAILVATVSGLIINLVMWLLARVSSKSGGGVSEQAQRTETQQKQISAANTAVEKTVKSAPAPVLATFKTKVEEIKKEIEPAFIEGLNDLRFDLIKNGKVVDVLSRLGDDMQAQLALANKKLDEFKRLSQKATVTQFAEVIKVTSEITAATAMKGNDQQVIGVVKSFVGGDIKDIFEAIDGLNNKVRTMKDTALKSKITIEEAEAAVVSGRIRSVDVNKSGEKLKEKEANDILKGVKDLQDKKSEIEGQLAKPLSDLLKDIRARVEISVKYYALLLLVLNEENQLLSKIKQFSTKKSNALSSIVSASGDAKLKQVHVRNMDDFKKAMDDPNSALTF